MAKAWMTRVKREARVVSKGLALSCDVPNKARLAVFIEKPVIAVGRFDVVDDIRRPNLRSQMVERAISVLTLEEK
jgi:hypothetical protein